MRSASRQRLERYSAAARTPDNLLQNDERRLNDLGTDAVPGKYRDTETISIWHKFFA
jgi:hypothetical protein